MSNDSIIWDYNSTILLFLHDYDGKAKKKYGSKNYYFIKYLSDIIDILKEKNIK